MPGEYQGRRHPNGEWASQYGQNHWGAPKIRREILEHTEDGRHIYDETFLALELKGTETILDAGCYDADDELYLVSELGHRGRLIAMDVPMDPPVPLAEDPRFNIFTLPYIEEHNIKNIDIVYGRLQQIPLANESVDIAMSLWSLIHVPENEIDLALSQLYRVLKPGGVLVIGTNGIGHKQRHHQVLSEMAQLLKARSPGAFSDRFKYEAVPEIVARHHGFVPEDSRQIYQDTRLPITEELLPAYEYSIGTYQSSFDPVPTAREWERAKLRSPEFQKILQEIDDSSTAYDDVKRGVLFYRRAA